MSYHKTMITQSRLHELFTYEATTGFLVRKRPVRGPKCLHQHAGWKTKDGYIKVFIDGRPYHCHRLVWTYHNGEWPPASIDHVNGNRGDNRIENLRLATTAQNSRNRGATKANPTGLKGVSYYRRNGEWRAQITANGKKYWLGTYRTPHEAHAAYQAAAERLHGEFAKTA